MKLHTWLILGGLAAVVITRLHSTSAIPPTAATVPAEDRIRCITHGDEFDLSKQLGEKGHWTVIAFTAPWCPGCRQLEPKLEELVKSKGTVALRTVDIVQWGSPVARQHDIHSIPQLWLYDGDKLVSKNTQDILERLQAAPTAGS